MSPWEKFAKGHWQTEMPGKVGNYPTADRLRERARDQAVVQDPRNPLVVVSVFELIHQGRQWAGWWWSEPYPELPTPPKW